jgi:hypothetical protein
MNSQLTRVVRSFFRRDAEELKFRSALRQEFETQFRIRTDQADALINYLIETGYLYQSTMRYARSTSGRILRDSCLGMREHGSDVLQTASV